MAIASADPNLSPGKLADIRLVRRIVTGENETGQSVIVSDGPPKNIVRPTYSPSTVQVLWATGEGAAKGDEPAPEGHAFGFHSEGGTILRIVDFPPDETCNADMVRGFLDDNGVRDHQNPRHFWFHKTPSLDYAICLEGEIVAMMDEGEAVMRAGDVLIQRATNHSWSNRSDKNCRMAFVLIALGEDEKS